MMCPHCGSEVQTYRQINSNGAKVVVKRCVVCHRVPDLKHVFYPKDENWDSLPLLEDFTTDAYPCCVKGCTNQGSELHHFAPRHLFDDANSWPMGFLCAKHHREWHEKTKTGSYAKHN